ncbi:hypothetical protein BH24DEI2_BH24DEI2_13050 [soil metagenome]
MAARTSGLWRLGMKNALVVGLVMLTAGMTLAGVISLSAHWGLGRSLSLAFVIVHVGIFASGFVNLICDKVKAGRLLYDADKHPQRLLFLFNAVIFSFMAVMDFLGPTSQGGNPFVQFLPYFLLTSAVFYFWQSFGRLQVREAGIWGYWGLPPWRKIGSYTWADDATLLIQPSSRFGFLRGGFAVPPEHRVTFESYLLEHTRSKTA